MHSNGNLCLPKFVSQDTVDTKGPKHYQVAFPFVTFNISKLLDSKLEYHLKSKEQEKESPLVSNEIIVHKYFGRVALVGLPFLSFA